MHKTRLRSWLSPRTMGITGNLPACTLVGSTFKAQLDWLETQKVVVKIRVCTAEKPLSSRSSGDSRQTVYVLRSRQENFTCSQHKGMRRL